MVPRRASRRRWLARAVSAAVLTATLAGCGRGPTSGLDSTPSPYAVSSSDRACRAKWQALGETVQKQAALGVDLRRAFAQRWNAVAAGVDYYSRTASSVRCGELLSSRRTSVDDLAALVTRALPYDARQRSRTTFAKRQTYAALPGGRDEPPRVERAYATVRKQTAAAADDLTPAYAELARAETSDAKAVALAMSDLRLLAETSDADRACTRATATIKAWAAGLTRKKKN